MDSSWLRWKSWATFLSYLQRDISITIIISIIVIIVIIIVIIVIIICITITIIVAIPGKNPEGTSSQMAMP